MSADPQPSRFLRLFGLLSLVAMVGGFVLSYAGTARYELTVLAWLGYPQYDMHAFVLGVAGLVGLVVYGYFVSDE